MTEIFIKCKVHGKTHIKEIILSDSWEEISGECGCTFMLDSTRIRNLTEERKINEYNKLHPYMDPRGRMYQDGSYESD